ncbi:hypothetical protein [Actinoallomurus iriomotensis]|nr:hypothetical protein [Actinoallomurus iriomotensis]
MTARAVLTAGLVPLILAFAAACGGDHVDRAKLKAGLENSLFPVGPGLYKDGQVDCYAGLLIKTANRSDLNSFIAGKKRYAQIRPRSDSAKSEFHGNVNTCIPKGQGYVYPNGW